jgi:hypothetical protein
VHFTKQSWHSRLTTIMMMAAMLAFVVQGMFVAASEAATGDSSHYYLGFVLHHASGEHHHSQIVAHIHADGITHAHAIDDDDDGDSVAKHIKQPGSNLALVVCVVPCLNVSTLSAVSSQKLTASNPRRLWVADLDGLTRPPRPTSIA